MANMIQATLTGENYQVEYHSDSITINFRGVLRLTGMKEYEAIDNLLTDVAATDPNCLTLNFEKLEFLNSSGFSVIDKFAIAMDKQKVTQIMMISSQNIAWQAKSLKNLKPLLPNFSCRV